MNFCWSQFSLSTHLLVAFPFEDDFWVMDLKIININPFLRLCLFVPVLYSVGTHFEMHIYSYIHALRNCTHVIFNLSRHCWARQWRSRDNSWIRRLLSCNCMWVVIIPINKNQSVKSPISEYKSEYDYNFSIPDRVLELACIRHSNPQGSENV